MNRVRYKDIPGRRGIIFLHPDGLWHTENFFIHQPVPIPKSLLRFAEIESYELPILPKDLLVPKIGIWNPISDIQSVLSDNPILIYERLGKRIGIQKNYFLRLAARNPFVFIPPNTSRSSGSPLLAERIFKIRSSLALITSIWSFDAPLSKVPFS